MGLSTRRLDEPSRSSHAAKTRLQQPRTGVSSESGSTRSAGTGEARGPQGGTSRPQWERSSAWIDRSNSTSTHQYTGGSALGREGSAFQGIGAQGVSPNAIGRARSTGSTPRNLPDPARLDGNGAATRRADDRLIVDGISIDDVQQGQAANCYAVASIAGVAHGNPRLLRNAVTDNGNGTYNVRLFDRNGRAQNITVDGDLYRNADGTPTYARGANRREIWPAIVEKAYAQMNGGYNAIGNGGNAADAMRALTGRGVTSRTNSRTSADRLYRDIQTATANGRPVVADTHGREKSGKYTTNGLSAWHSYTVTGVSTDDSGQRWVNLRNPWGNTEYTNTNYATDRDRNGDGTADGDDGHFRMKIEDYQRLYRTTHVGR